MNKKFKILLGIIFLLIISSLTYNIYDYARNEKEFNERYKEYNCYIKNYHIYVYPCVYLCFNLDINELGYLCSGKCKMNNYLVSINFKNETRWFYVPLEENKFLPEGTNQTCYFHSDKDILVEKSSFIENKVMIGILYLSLIIYIIGILYMSIT